MLDNTKKSLSGLFISYARSDGIKFAKDLRSRLSEKYYFQVWQDIVELEGGKDWWLQIEVAIKSVEFLVMVMTPGALRSEITRKEWRLARQEGVCVLPVMAEEIDFTTLPRWMRDAHFFDFKFPEQWDRFIRTLQSPCQAPRVPFMVEDKPDDFVERPEEFNQLLALLLDPKREEPIAITAALRGAGGYGKTTLAKALCHDERIQNAFDDGILWVTLGENPGDLTGRVEDLIYTLSGERPGFSSVQAAAVRLAELLADRDILMVIDDVWNSAHLTPFLQGGSRCSRLITTRNSDTLPPKTVPINLDAMQQREAAALLGFNLPKGDKQALSRLAARLGEWPLLLKLVNPVLRVRVFELHQPLTEAIIYVNRALDKRGLTAFDARNPIDRNQAVAKTLSLSFDLLSDNEQTRYNELAIFPEDVDIPLATIEKLWHHAGYDDFDTEALCQRLHGFSLLFNFDLNRRTVRLHDVIRAYLYGQQKGKLFALHRRLLDALCPSPVPSHLSPSHVWTRIPHDEPYLWRHLAYHLHASGQTKTLRTLLLDYGWLASKLAVCEVNALLADYDFFPEDRELQLVQSTLRLSANQCAHDHKQLPSQLHGRLVGHSSSGLRSLLEQAKKQAKRPWLRPLTPCLTTPGGPLLRTLEGHSGPVNAIAITPDGKNAVSASSDKTLKVWDLTLDQPLRTLEGHTDSVMSVTITPDGKYAMSASSDKTLKVWDLASGQVLRTLEGHNDWVMSVAITPDGKYAVSTSRDKMLKIWDLASGQALQTLEGHSHWVNSVVITPDGKYAVSASSDKTIRVWDLVSGQTLRTFALEHEDWINSVVITPDGKYVVSASDDRMLKVWNLTSGQVLQTLKGHSGPVRGVTIMPEGKHVVSASRDGALKVWDLASGQMLRTLEGHSDWVNSVALTPDGKHAVSASWDHTLKIWDLASGQTLQAVEGHMDWVTSVAFTPKGKCAVSASKDGTLKVWDWVSGQAPRSLGGGYNGSVNSVAVTPDGVYAVSALWDGTLKMWNWVAGEVLQTLVGHTWSVNSVTITPDGMHALSASSDETLKVWDLASGQALLTLRDYGQMIKSAAMTPDGKYAVSASSDKTLKVWDLASGQAMQTLNGHSNSVMSVAITSSGKYAVSASSDMTLKVWDLASGRVLRTLEGHRDSVWSVALTFDDKYAVSASDDHTLKVWELSTGKAIATFWGESPMKCCAIASDRRTIVAGDESGRMYFLRLEGL